MTLKLEMRNFSFDNKREMRTIIRGLKKTSRVTQSRTRMRFFEQL